MAAILSVRTRAPDLDRFLAQRASAPFVYSETDCCVVMADWLVLNGYPDALAEPRGRCRDEAAARRFVAPYGGLAAYIATQFANIGLQRTRDPARGDVALLRAPVADRILGAICLGGDGPVWWMKTRDGAVLGPAPVLRAWKTGGANG
jgi:hypothetical protein